MTRLMSEIEIPSRIHTFTGKFVDPLDLQPEDVCIEDIAHHLSNQCRWSGAVRTNYNVAQHSVLVAHHVPYEDALPALLHDGSETYTQDMAHPLKVSVVGDEFRKVEARIDRVIAEVFGLPYPKPPSVKEADVRMLITEARDLMHGHQQWGYYQDIEPYPDIITPWSHELAEQIFLGVYQSLTAVPEEITQ